MSHASPQDSQADLHAIQADLNQAAERIWLACSPTCPTISIEVLPEIGSTNTELMDRGRRGDTAPTFLTACRQTAGRGRLGRTWQATLGDSLTFSLGVPIKLDQVPGGGSALSLAVGLAIAQAIDQGMAHRQAQGLPSTLQSVGLKWPNDLWLGTRKLGGILIEASPAPGLADGQRWVVIGVGLNVRQGSAPEGSASLQGAHVSAAEVWSWVAPALLQAVQAFEAQGFAPLQTLYAQRDVLLGQTVGLWATPGQYPADGHPPSQTGLAAGVDGTGALLVHTDQGVQCWTSGDVSVRPHQP
jgi:BirA family biotin operon repressor/biotin-[acetyl-CoA-carboxylase] ligase